MLVGWERRIAIVVKIVFASRIGTPHSSSMLLDGRPASNCLAEFAERASIERFEVSFLKIVDLVEPALLDKANVQRMVAVRFVLGSRVKSHRDPKCV